MKKDTEILFSDSYELKGFEEADLFGLKLKEKDGNREVTLLLHRDQVASLGIASPAWEAKRIPSYITMSALLYAQNIKVKKAVIHNKLDGRLICGIYLEDEKGNEFMFDALAGMGVVFAMIHQVKLYMSEQLLNAEQQEGAAIHWTDLNPEFALNELSKLDDKQLSMLAEKELDQLLAFTNDREEYELSNRIKSALESKNQ